MTAQRIFLRLVVDLGAAHLVGHVLIDNKPGTVRESADEIHSAAARYICLLYKSAIERQACLVGV